MPRLSARFILFLILLLPAVAASAQDGTIDRPIRIGFNGGDSPGIIQSKAGTFCAFLEERSKLICEPVVVESYSQLIRTIAEGKVDFAFLSPLGYITAAKVAHVELLLKSVRGGQPYYWSVLLVLKDSGITNLNDLKGKRLAFTHLGSTSGYVIPMSSLLAQGIDPDRYFSEITYAGGHQSVIRQILDGTVDVGATFADDPKGKVGSWTSEEFLDKRDARRLTPIFFSDRIPGDTFIVTRTMNKDRPRLASLIKHTLMIMGDSRPGQVILRDLYNIDSLTEAVDADYDPVREAFEGVRSR
ncbi:MAG: phosphate/phosphite/phosphonate ABC transporter substrate-binding protein [bacterium]|nr:phosphate/phosphite/phosphonate ABC transporter substrate-binding protein [bacterium]